MGRAIMVAAAAVLLVLTAACGGGDDDEADDPPVTTTTTAVATLPTPPPVPASECRPADESDVTSIDLSMTKVNSTIDEAYTATDGPYRYIDANIYEADGMRLPGPAMWVFDGDALYALSDSALAHSDTLPEGRTLGLSPFDEAPIALQDCVIVATP
jgi:hypothetical protein